jgi:hypothetical protein
MSSAAAAWSHVFSAPAGLVRSTTATLVFASDDAAAAAVGLPAGFGSAGEERGDRHAEDPRDVAERDERRACLARST